MLTNILANHNATVVLYYFLETPNLALSYSKLKEKTLFSNNVLYSAIDTLIAYNILIRENKKYALNFHNHKTEEVLDILKKEKSKFKLITTKTYLNIKDIMKFLENKNFEKVYLFGSVAKGTARIDSDIDIAIISEKELKELSDWQLYFEMKNIKVEFHYFRKLDKNNKIDKQVLEEGILLMRR